MQDLKVESVLCQHIRAAISDGSLPPGTKLTEELLAEVWGVNRSRVRTVLQRLAFEDLVELRRNRGAFVSHPTAKEAKDVFEARRVIERVTTGIVTRTIITPRLNQLLAEFSDRDRTWVHGNRQSAIAITSTFHRNLAALAHNESLATALERLILRSALIFGVFGTRQTFSGASDTYDDLLAFLERGESIRAAAAMERCLFALEKGLDFRPSPPPEVDLQRVVGRLVPAG